MVETAVMLRYAILRYVIAHIVHRLIRRLAFGGEDFGARKVSLRVDGSVQIVVCTKFCTLQTILWLR